MVITQLLGFPWSRYAKQLCLDPHSILEGHVTTDQAIQAGSLLEMYCGRLDWVHDRTRGILLAEDRAELTALSGEMQARLETVLGPAQWEEFLLRMLWSKEVADECRFEFAELTGAEVRQVVRIADRIDVHVDIGALLQAVDIGDHLMTGLTVIDPIPAGASFIGAAQVGHYIRHRFILSSVEVQSRTMSRCTSGRFRKPPGVTTRVRPYAGLSKWPRAVFTVTR